MRTMDPGTAVPCSSTPELWDTGLTDDLEPALAACRACPALDACRAYTADLVAARLRPFGLVQAGEVWSYGGSIWRASEPGSDARGFNTRPTCRRGHPWTEATTQWRVREDTGSRYRQCAECKRDNERARRARQQVVHP